MAGKTYKTEAIVLRSMRFSEADRILHLYTAHRVLTGAIAEGVRKATPLLRPRLAPLRRRRLRRACRGSAAPRPRRGRGDRAAALDAARRCTRCATLRPRAPRRALRRHLLLRRARRLSSEDALGVIRALPGGIELDDS